MMKKGAYRSLAHILARDCVLLGCILQFCIVHPLVSAKPTKQKTSSQSESLLFSSRPLVLPRGQFRASLAANEFTAQLVGEVNADRGLLFHRHFFNDNRFTATPTIALGVIEKLELGLSLPTVAISPSFFFNNMSLYGRYALGGKPRGKPGSGSRQKTDLAVEAAVLLPVRGDYGFSVGGFMRMYVNPRWRLDIGPKAEMVVVGEKNFTEETGYFYPFGGSLPKKFRWHVFVPVATTVNVTQHIFAGLHTGIALSSLIGDNIGFYETMRIHSGFQGGYTLLHGTLDLITSVTFPYLYLPFQPASRFNADVFEINIGATYRMSWY